MSPPPLGLTRHDHKWGSSWRLLQVRGNTCVYMSSSKVMQKKTEQVEDALPHSASVQVHYFSRWDVLVGFTNEFQNFRRGAGVYIMQSRKKKIGLYLKKGNKIFLKIKKKFMHFLEATF